MRILLLGAGGALGSTIMQTFSDDTIITAGRGDLQVSRGDCIRALVEKAQPDCVINCAADTNVEGAEMDPSDSFAANVILPELAATACRKANAILVHYSSTGCYGSWKSTAYDEADEPRPTTAHHVHKLAGERAVRASNCDAIVIRTGWLFGGVKQSRRNFVWRRIDEASSNSEIYSDPFQIGNPTYVVDLAEQTRSMLRMNLRGTFNCVSQPAVNRQRFVEAIVEASGVKCSVRSAEKPFPRLAKVSPNEAAINRKLELLGADRMPTWTSSLKSYISSSR